MKQTQGAYTKTRPYWDDMKQRNTSRQMRSTDTTDNKGKVITDHLGHNLKSLQTLLEIPTFGVGESPEARAVVEMFEFALRTIKGLTERVKKLEERRSDDRANNKTDTGRTTGNTDSSKSGKADLPKVPVV